MEINRLMSLCSVTAISLTSSMANSMDKTCNFSRTCFPIFPKGHPLALSARWAPWQLRKNCAPSSLLNSPCLGQKGGAPGAWASQTPSVGTLLFTLNGGHISSLSCPVLPVEIVFFRGVPRKQLERPTDAWGLRRGHVRGLPWVPSVPPPSAPPWKKPVLSSSGPEVRPVCRHLHPAKGVPVPPYRLRLAELVCMAAPRLRPEFRVCVESAGLPAGL